MDEVERRMMRIIRDGSENPLDFIGYADGQDFRELYIGWGALPRERWQCGMIDYSDHHALWDGFRYGEWGLPIRKYRQGRNGR